MVSCTLSPIHRQYVCCMVGDQGREGLTMRMSHENFITSLLPMSGQ